MLQPPPARPRRAVARRALRPPRTSCARSSPAPTRASSASIASCAALLQAIASSVPAGSGSSVVIAASAPHRAEALAACKEAIDELKTSVPLWKKEVYEGGEEWIGQGS